jgi:S-adenosylmethionine/arginine decarboxylase-like enzyme
MERTPKLGERMFSRGIVLRGKLSCLRWQRFLVEAAEAMGMTAVANPALWNYPIAGAGGNGFTICQPITESFLALDAWPDHDGAYLFICSCKPFAPHCLRDVVARFGLTEDDMTPGETLRLV